MEIIPEIIKRQSIRKFKSIHLEREKLDRILEAGRTAPSAKNRQPWRFIVIDKDELKEKIQQAAFNQEHVGSAGAIIAACSTNIDYRMPNGQLSYPIDIAFATAFMMLQAVKEELGSCIVTTFDEDEIRNLLTVPHTMKIVLLLLVGYPAETPLQEIKKPLKRIASFNHW